MNEVADFRCPGLPDMPYSSYCKVCWYPVYSLWMERDDHKGVCINGSAYAATCAEAVNRAKFTADLEHAKAMGYYSANHTGVKIDPKTFWDDAAEDVQKIFKPR